MFFVCFVGMVWIGCHLAHRLANALMGNDENAAGACSYRLLGLRSSLPCCLPPALLLPQMLLYPLCWTSAPSLSWASQTSIRTPIQSHKTTGLEFCFIGPTLRFHSKALIALMGAQFGSATLDGQPLGKWWQSIQVCWLFFFFFLQSNSSG